MTHFCANVGLFGFFFWWHARMCNNTGQLKSRAIDEVHEAWESGSHEAALGAETERTAGQEEAPMDRREATGMCAEV